MTDTKMNLHTVVFVVLGQALLTVHGNPVGTMETGGVIDTIVPIPDQVPGLVIGKGNRDAKVIVEAGMDLNCPDSAAAWPVLLQLASAYNPTDVSVMIHQFPLPYHRYAVLTTQALLLVQHENPEKVQDFITFIYQHVNEFSTDATVNKSEPQMLGRLSVLGEQSTGIPRAVFQKNIALYRDTVITTWKYAARRSMAGTPWFFINGVEVTVDGTLTLDDWKKFIGGLLKEDTTVAKQAQPVPLSQKKSDDSPLSSHILDTSLGLPGPGVFTTVSVKGSDGNWNQLDTCITNSDGRCIYTFDKKPGNYLLTFQVAPYFEAQKVTSFFPSIQVEFLMTEDLDHYHVPLLLSPYSYSTYRGS